MSEDEDKELDKLLYNTSFKKLLTTTFVSSSILSEAKYNEKEKILTIIFSTDLKSKYIYFDVPASIVKDFFKLSEDDKVSAGQYFYKNIKKKFLFTKQKAEEKT